MGQNLNGLNHGQPRLVADNTPGRVIDHDLVAALVLAADICHRQRWRCGASNRAVVEQPLVRQWLAARRLHLKQGSFAADGPRRLRLLGDDDRLVDHHLHLFTGGLAGGVFHHHAVGAGIVRLGAVDFQYRLGALQHLLAVHLPMIRKRAAAPGGHAQDELISLVSGVRRRLGQDDGRQNDLQPGAGAADGAHRVGDVHLVDAPMIILHRQDAQLRAGRPVHGLAVVIPLVGERPGSGCGHLQDRHRALVGPGILWLGDDGDRLQNLHLEHGATDAAHGVDHLDLVQARVVRRDVFNQQIRSTTLIKCALTIPVVGQRLRSARAGLKLHCAARQDRLILHLPGQLGHHADVELGLTASHAAGFVPHLNLVQAAVTLRHDADLEHRPVGAVDRAAAVGPLVAQRAGAAGLDVEARDRALAHGQILHVLRDLHWQNHHQCCGSALDRAAAVGNQHGVVCLIRNRDSLQMQLRSRRTLQRHPVLEPLVGQGLAAPGDQAERHRLALHHALAGGCLHDLRQRHHVQAGLAAPDRPDRIGHFHLVAASVGQAHAFQLEHRAVGLLEQRPVVEPPVGHWGASAHLHAELGTPADQRHGIPKVGHQLQRQVDRQQGGVTLRLSRLVADAQTVEAGALAGDPHQCQVRLHGPLDGCPVVIPLEEQRLRPGDSNLEHRLAALVDGLLERLPCELRPLVDVEEGLAPHGVDLVRHLHGVQAFLQLADAVQHQFLPRLVRQLVALEKPPVRERARALRLDGQDDIRADAHGAILQAGDDLHRQVQRQARRLAHKLPAGVGQAHVVQAGVRPLDGGQVEHHRVLAVDQFAVLVPLHLDRLGAGDDQDELVRVAQIDRRGVQPALEHRWLEHIQQGNLASRFAEVVGNLHLVAPGLLR